MSYPRIEYNSLIVDFERRFNELENNEIDTTFQNQAASGVEEDLFFFQHGALHP